MGENAGPASGDPDRSKHRGGRRFAPELPVTVAVSRRVTAHNRDAANEWARELVDAARGFHGYLDSEIRTIDRDGAVDVVVGLNFARSQDLVAWEESDARTEHVRRGEQLTEGPMVGLTMSNLDMLWTAPPSVATASLRWWTTLWVWTALMPAALLINLLLIPHLEGLAPVLRTLISTVILVPWVTWIGLPAVHFVRTRVGSWVKRRNPSVR